MFQFHAKTLTFYLFQFHANKRTNLTMNPMNSNSMQTNGGHSNQLLMYSYCTRTGPFDNGVQRVPISCKQATHLNHLVHMDSNSIQKKKEGG